MNEKKDKKKSNTKMRTKIGNKTKLNYKGWNKKN
jgi:hypothetical protein